MKKLPFLLYIVVAVVLISTSAITSGSHISNFAQAFKTQVAHAQTQCEEDPSLPECQTNPCDSNPSADGCPCPAGYTGSEPNCTYVDPCQEDPTADGCPCPAPSTGTEPSCTNIDPCDEDPTTTGCPCISPLTGTQPSCICHDAGNPDCENYDICIEYPLSDQCNQTCSNTTYYNDHISECGTCADQAYADAHPEECNDPYYCCDPCSPNNPSYEYSNFDPNADQSYCEQSICTESATLCNDIQPPPPPPVPGCMDNSAANYNAQATEDDGSCYWQGSCDVKNSFSVDYTQVDPSVNYHGAYEVAQNWSDWPVPIDTTICQQIVNAGVPEDAIRADAPNMTVGSSCGEDCHITQISHDNDCPEGQIKNTNDECVSASDDCVSHGGAWINGACDISTATCGNATTKAATSTAPSQGLCDAGVPSSVSSSGGDTAYTWHCTSLTGITTASCTAPECQGAACNTVSPSSCGPADGGIFTSEPVVNLCNSGNTASTVDRSGNTYTWTCTNDISHSVTGSCSGTYGTAVCTDSTVPCNGVCVAGGTCDSNSSNPGGGNNGGNGGNGNHASSTLLNYFTIVPHYVATSSDTCLVSWSANLPPNPNGGYLGGCALNDVPLSSASSSMQKYPGTYTFECQIGTDYQIKTGRCEINPIVREK